MTEQAKEERPRWPVTATVRMDGCDITILAESAGAAAVAMTLLAGGKKE